VASALCLLSSACGAYGPNLEEISLPDSGELEGGDHLDAAVSPEAFLPSPDVQLDSTFGLGGSLGGYLSAWTPVGLAIDAEGRIVVAGPSNDPSSPSAEIVRRLTPDGTLDETFGVAGHVTLDLSPNQWQQALRSLPDGTVGVLGAASVDGASAAFAARLKADGSLDPRFAGQPLVSTSSGQFSAGFWQDDGSAFCFGAQSVVFFDPSGGIDAAYGAIRPSSRIVTGALGKGALLWTGAGSRVSRYLLGGATDESFGQGGSVDLTWADLGPVQPTLSVLLAQPSGGVVVVGSHTSAERSYVDIGRLTEAGGLDGAFGAGRFVSAQTAGGPVGGAELADGRVVVWTAGAEIVATDSHGSMIRVFNLGVLGTVLAAALDASGRLVVAGIITSNPVNTEWFVRRYLIH
jgi:uncharacterized delta-60 repeat protein